MKNSMFGLLLTVPFWLSGCGDKDELTELTPELTPEIVTAALKDGAVEDLKKQGIAPDPKNKLMIDEMMKLITVESVQGCNKQADKSTVCDVTITLVEPTSGKKLTRVSKLKFAKIEELLIASEVSED